MSRAFTSEKLYEIYNEYLPVFVMLAKASVKQEVDFCLKVNAHGEIFFSSEEEGTDSKGRKVISEHHISQGKEKISDGTDMYFKQE